jgi:hypothetical protein
LTSFDLVIAVGRRPSSAGKRAKGKKGGKVGRL